MMSQQIGRQIGPGSNTSGFSRRQLLKAGSAAAVVGAASAAGCGRSQSNAHAQSAGLGQRIPQNIILMVSDGMSMGVPSLADPFSKLVRNRPTHWPKLSRADGVTNGLGATDSGNSLVTDSAAASTAWSTGVQINNGTLNITPDGTRLIPLAVQLKSAGKQVGLVVTDVITGGTPGGFGAVQLDRNNFLAIALEYLGVIDVLMGGGRRYFDSLSRPDRYDLLGMYRTRGYQFMDQRSQLLSASRSEKVLGLFAEGKLPFSIDHINTPDLRNQVPTLAEMTQHALSCLSESRNPNGFFLMVEGARIDHAAHANDAAAILWEQMAFDDALGVALEFVEDRNDTLVVVTSDHGNANPGLNGMGKSYSNSDQTFQKLAQSKSSFVDIYHAIHRDLPGDRRFERGVQQIIQDKTGIRIDKMQALSVGEAIMEGRAIDEMNRQHRSWPGMLGQVLGNHHGVQWTGVSHTADYVMLSALGPASEALAGVNHLTHFNDVLVDLWKLQKQRPTQATAQA